MIPIRKTEDSCFAIPDAKEFVAKTGWSDGKFVVCESIEGENVYTSYGLAAAEAYLLEKLIFEARKLEAELA